MDLEPRCERTNSQSLPFERNTNDCPRVETVVEGDCSCADALLKRWVVGTVTTEQLAVGTDDWSVWAFELVERGLLDRNELTTASPGEMGAHFSALASAIVQHGLAGLIAQVPVTAIPIEIGEDWGSYRAGFRPEAANFESLPAHWEGTSQFVLQAQPPAP